MEKVGKLLKRYEINNCGNQTLAEETIIFHGFIFVYNPNVVKQE